MNKAIQLEILCVDNIVYKGPVARVQVPGELGSFEILYNHAPLISSLVKGKIRVIDLEKKTTFIEVESGVLEVSDNHIVILMGS